MNSKLITTFKKYKEVYHERLKDYISQYEDFDELDFIKYELVYFDNCLKNSNVILQEKKRYYGECYEYDTYYEYEVKDFEFIDLFVNKEVQKLISYELDWKTLGDSHPTNYFNLEICERLTLSFSKIIDFLNHKENEIKNPIAQPIQNKVKFHGNQTQFLELIKSLIENGNLKGSQNEIITNCSKFFNIEINNPDQTLSKIKGRNNNSETLFLDQLKKTLFDHITTEKTR
jgi:hypothetical protein